MSSSADYVLCVLICCLVTVSTRYPLELNLTDSTGIAIIKFRRHQLIKFYNCLCGSMRKTCEAYADTYDEVYDQRKIDGPGDNFFQFHCSKHRKDDMLCTRFPKLSTSCRAGEKNWTFNISPSERKCGFASSISITLNKWSSITHYDKRILSFIDCTNPNSDDSLIIIAAVVAVSIFLIVVLTIVVFIFFKNKRKRSKNHQINVKYKTPVFATPSMSPDNTVIPSPHTESSAQNIMSSDLNTAVTLSSTKAKEKTGTDTSYCNVEANRSINNALAIPPLDQVEYCNISGEIKENLSSVASRGNQVTVLNVASDRKRTDTSCYEEVLAENLGISTYNANSARTYQVDAKIIMTKPCKNSSDERKKENSTNEQEQHVYTAVNKLKQNPSEEYCTLKETVREMTNPYNLLLDPSENENTKQNVTNGKQKRCLEFEKEDGYSDGEDISPALPDPYVESQTENVYEDDP